MLVVETIAKIRRAYFVQKKAIKEICRELKVSRKVVRRVVRSGATEFVYERKVQPQPKIGPWREELDRLLVVNAARASRERLTLIRVFEELRGLELHERLLSHRRGRFAPAELMTAASASGYASLGWTGGGALAVRAPADFVTVRSDTVRTAGCRPDQIAYAATAADVDRVVVAGRTIVADGEHVLGPVGPLLSAALAPLIDVPTKMSP